MTKGNRNASNEVIADSLTKMVTEWVEFGIKHGLDWRRGLGSIIEQRLDRFRSAQAAQAGVVSEQPLQPQEQAFESRGPANLLQEQINQVQRVDEDRVAASIRMALNYMDRKTGPLSYEQYRAELIHFLQHNEAWLDTFDEDEWSERIARLTRNTLSAHYDNWNAKP